MTELEKHLTDALTALSEQYEREQTRLSAQIAAVLSGVLFRRGSSAFPQGLLRQELIPGFRIATGERVVALPYIFNAHPPCVEVHRQSNPQRHDDSCRRRHIEQGDCSLLLH